MRTRPLRQGPGVVTDIDGIDAASLDSVPIRDRAWSVLDWVPRGQVTLLSGHGGLGKSIVALQALVAHTAEAQWLGLDIEQAPAYGLFCEDNLAEIHRRLDDVLRSVSRNYKDLNGLRIASMPGGDVDLFAMPENARDPGPTPLWEQLREVVLEMSARLVVIDAASDVFAAEEIRRTHVRRFIRMLRALAIEMDAAVILIVHPSRAGLEAGDGFSGSTAWWNSSRSVLLLEEVKDDPDERVLKRVKGNYAARGDELRLRYVDGAFIRAGELSSLDAAAIRHRAMRVFIELLTKRNSVGLRVTNKKTTNYAPKVMATDHPDGSEVGLKALEQAMSALILAGQVKIAEHGYGKSKRSHLEVADPTRAD